MRYKTGKHIYHFHAVVCCHRVGKRGRYNGLYSNRLFGHGSLFYTSCADMMEEIYAEYGRYLNKVDSFEFPGLTGMDKMAGIMQGLREKPLTEIAGIKVVHKLIRTVRTLHCDPHTVCIRIRGQHQIRTCLFRQVQPLFQSLEDLRVRVMVLNSGTF